jgi:hypothetical protein
MKAFVEADRRFRGAYRLHYHPLMAEAVRTSETCIYFNETTRRYIPEGCRVHTRRHEKSHTVNITYTLETKDIN